MRSGRSLGTGLAPAVLVLCAAGASAPAGDPLTDAKARVQALGDEQPELPKALNALGALQLRAMDRSLRSSH